MYMYVCMYVWYYVHVCIIYSSLELMADSYCVNTPSHVHCSTWNSISSVSIGKGMQL